jgi:hypothetical protein
VNIHEPYGLTIVADMWILKHDGGVAVMENKTSRAHFCNLLKSVVSIFFFISINTSLAIANSVTSVRSANALCSVVDGTGLASRRCEVSGWESSVTATIDMNSSEARDLCQKVASLKPVAVNRIHCDRLYLLFSRMYVIVLLRTIKRDML